MEEIRKARRTGLIVALVLSAAFPLGGVMLGVGLGMNVPAVWAVGIALLAAGFYGCPIAWISYGNKRTYYRFVSAVEEEHLYSYADLAAQLGISEKEVRNRVDVCMNKRWLVGYIRESDRLALNTNNRLSERKDAVECPYCGAKFMQKITEDTVCPYCGSPFRKKEN